MAPIFDDAERDESLTTPAIYHHHHIRESTPQSFQCATCKKVYTRYQNLRRHEASHIGRPSKRRALGTACARCRIKKDSCDGESPCARCRKAGVACERQDMKRRKRRALGKACARCRKKKNSCDGESPCARCRKAGVACERMDNYTSYTSDAVPTWPTERDVGSSYADSDTGLNGQRVGITSMDLLRESTISTGNRPSATIAAEAAELDHTHGEAHVQPDPERHVIAHDELYPEFSETPSVSFGFLFLMTEDPHSRVISDWPTPKLGYGHALKVRITELLHELSAKHCSLWERKLVNATFDYQLAKAVLTVGNVRHFAWAFFRHIHPSFPILHMPTFDLQTVSLPLLIALIIFGSMPNLRSESSIAIRTFSHVAEAYIFDQLAARSLNSSSWQTFLADQSVMIDDEHLQLMQAGLLFLVFLNNNNDIATRRRIRLQRIPALVAAMRTSGLFAHKQRHIIPCQDRDNWEAFIADEIRIRLGMWTCIFDSTLSVFFNTTPQVAICEMTGGLPCEERLFAAKSAGEFARLASLQPPRSQADTLPELMSRVLFSPVPRRANEPEEVVPPRNLLLLICALLSIVMTSGMNLLTFMNVEPMFHATNRWKALWDAATQDGEGLISPDMGFEKHAAEYWRLTKTLLRASKSGDRSYRHMQPEPCDSAQDLHDFLLKHN